MSQLHLFNPGHETAILFSERQYTPKANVLKMQKDLALLPLWYGERGDYVWSEEKIDNTFLSLLPKGLTPNASMLSLNLQTKLIAAPWGLSPQSLKTFEGLKEKQEIPLQIPAWKEEFIALTGRHTAALCLDKIKQLLPGSVLPETPVFYTNIPTIKKHLSAHHPPFVIKTPYSSSGQGILWIHSSALAEKEEEWTQGAIRKQGCVSIEKGLQKLQDFALEFYLDEQGDVNYKGLSVFDTAEKGTYSGNRLAAQETMQKELLQHIEEPFFEQVKSAVMQTIKAVYGKIYTGYLGVDMLLYADQSNAVRIHPCVEVNMRYTMGMVAVRLFEDYIASSAKGYFHVTYENDCKEKDAEMKNKYPLLLDNGRISKGYISLCPVTEDTRYRAYILIE
ncbi:hypothetical protein LJC57_04110 [Parabacteroides sp. OttesenSCG-928-G07]|nr:hypothetical protein [Parabacteroides sp. OttesenSCG-928-G07]